MIALNAVSVLLFFLFYRPPTFNMLHKERTKWTVVKQVDYIGLILVTGGLALVLVALQWVCLLDMVDYAFI
jgi:hypothetical protein